MLRRLLSFVASLQLTLICLAAAIALIFAGTIAQVHLGIHEAQQRYFQSLLVWWPPEGGVRIPIFPGGHLIGGVLLVNLIAARLLVHGSIEQRDRLTAAEARDLVHFRRSPCARGCGWYLIGMHPPIFVREPSGAERGQLEASLRAASAFTVRRAQIVLLSAAGRRPRAIARGLCCAVQTVRNAIRAFNARGLAALSAGSSRPKSAAPALGEAELERLRALLHQSPRAFGQPRSTWTLALLARVAHERGLSATVLSEETIRRALLRLGVGWKRAKRWLTSPDPAYARKKVAATA